MGKKSKKKRKKEKQQLQKTPVHVLEHNAQVSLGKGDYVNAVRQLNMIPPQDREAYVPLLKKCYKSLFDAGLQDRDTGKAKKALNQLIKLNGNTDSLEIERTRIALLKGDLDTAFNLAVNFLRKSPISTINGKDIVLTGDIIAISFRDFSPVREKHPQLYDEISAIREAVELLSRQEYESASSAIKKVGFTSPVAHWRLLVKGMVSFYTNDDETAGKAFKKIPDNTLIYNTAQTYITVLDYKTVIPLQHKNSKRLNHVLLLLNDKDLQDILPRAEYLWRSGRQSDAYMHLRSKIKEFPPVSPGFLHELAGFIFNAILIMDSDRGYKLYVRLSESVAHRGIKNGFERYLFSRVSMISLLKDHYADNEAELGCMDFLRDYESLYGKDALVWSQVYAALAIYYAAVDNEHVPFCDFFQKPKKRRMLNSKKSESFFKKAIELTPENKNLYTGLFNMYESSNQKSKANKLLDTMISNFPEDKNTLLVAGTRCLERNACLKGKAYIEKAHILDPLDATVKSKLCEAYVLLGLDYAKNRKPEKFRPLLTSVMAHLKTGQDSFNLDPACYYSRWAAFELIGGEKARADELIQKALAEPGDPLARLYFSILIMKKYGVYTVDIDMYEKKLTSEIKDIAAHKVLSLIKTLLYFSNTPHKKQYWLFNEQSRIITIINKLKSMPCEPALLREIIILLRKDRKESFKFAGIVEMLAKKALKTEKNAPFFRSTLIINKYDNSFYPPERKYLNDLRALLKEAEKQSDLELITMIKTFLNKYEEQHRDGPPDFLPEMPDITFDEIDEDDEMDDFLLPDFFDILKKRQRKKKRKKKTIKNKKAPQKQKNSKNKSSRDEDSKQEKVDSLQLNLFD